MSKLESKLDEIRGHLVPAWSDARQNRLERKLGAEREKRAFARKMTLVVVPVMVTAAAAAFVLSTRDRVVPAVIASRVPEQSNAFIFADGSRAIPHTPNTHFQVLRSEPNEVVVRLLGPGARFDVVPNRARVFRVEFKNLFVEVLGTEFTLEQKQDVVEVSVDRGHVRVHVREEEKDLFDGEKGVFSIAAEEEIGRDGGDVPLVPPTKVSAPHSVKVLSPHSARREGGPENAEVKVDLVGELFRAADDARKNRSFDEAQHHLFRIVNDFEKDERAPLAAFVRGRLLMEELARPKDAAAAFAHSRKLSPRGALASDCFAREIEALARAGEMARGRGLFEEYRRQFPDAQHLERLEHVLWPHPKGE